MQGIVYRMMPCNTKMKKYWLKLSGIELLTYRREEDEEPKQSMSLKNVFIKEESKFELSTGKVLFAFSILHSLKKRKYFIDGEEERDKWIQKIKEVLGSRLVEDEYTIGKVLGKGRFSDVREGMNISTNKQVALKIIKKVTVELLILVGRDRCRQLRHGSKRDRGA